MYEKIKEHLSNTDMLCRFLGIELDEVGQGFARARVELGEQHMNGAGLAHGGTLFTLADFAFAAASNSHGTLALGINASISYLRAGRQGVLTAEAREVSRNHKLATYDVRVTDEQGEVLALFQGTVYRKRDSLLPE